MAITLRLALGSHTQMFPGKLETRAGSIVSSLYIVHKDSRSSAPLRRRRYIRVITEKTNKKTGKNRSGCTKGQDFEDEGRNKQNIWKQKRIVLEGMYLISRSSVY